MTLNEKDGWTAQELIDFESEIAEVFNRYRHAGIPFKLIKLGA